MYNPEGVYEDDEAGWVETDEGEVLPIQEAGREQTIVGDAQAESGSQGQRLEREIPR